jgi:hypothetical protein
MTVLRYDNHDGTLVCRDESRSRLVPHSTQILQAQVDNLLVARDFPSNCFLDCLAGLSGVMKYL